MASQSRLITQMPRVVSYFLVRPSRDMPVCPSDLRADAIYYVSSHYKPHTLIDVATLTGYVIHAPKQSLCLRTYSAMEVSLGEVYSGVFSASFLRRSLDAPRSNYLQTSDSLWNELHEAGEIEYDRFWRMPLDEEYGPQIYSSNADLCNVRTTRDLFLSS